MALPRPALALSGTEAQEVAHGPSALALSCPSSGGSLAPGAAPGTLMLILGLKPVPGIRVGGGGGCSALRLQILP